MDLSSSRSSRLISCSISRRSSSPRAPPTPPDSLLSLSQYLVFLGDFSLELFLNLEGNLKDDNERLRPLVKMSLFALSFLSNSFCCSTLLSGGVGPDLAPCALLGKGGVITSFIIICSGNSWLGDRSCRDPWEGLNKEVRRGNQRKFSP